MSRDLLAWVDELMAEVKAMGVEIVPGMPVPEDDEHARMAVHMLTGLISAHKNGRHTAFCRCSLQPPSVPGSTESDPPTGPTQPPGAGGGR